MGGKEPETTAEELLAHAGWLRRLALRLVADPDVADDLVQETWIAAARRAPDTSKSLRPWLAKVLRDAFRMRARSEGRRSAREQAAAIVCEDEVPTPELLVARAEAQRRLVDLVLELDEPYRTAVLLHYCEGVSMADIARAQGVPAGTVRWRVKVAIDDLRAQLDRSGDRRRWAVTLLALPKGTLVAHKTSKIAILILLLLMAVGGVVALLRHAGSSDGGDPTGGGSRAMSAPPGSAHTAGEAEELPDWLGQRGLQRRRIAGRVTSLEGAPVAGASVQLASMATMGGLIEQPRRITNAAGEFDFGPQLAMGYTVHASATGRTGTSQTLDLRDPVSKPPPERLELRLGACERAMVGTVGDASGGPIAGARILWLRPADGPGHSVLGGVAAETDADGAYELCVDGGRTRLTVQVSAAGYGAVAMQAQVWGRDRYDFSLVPEAIVVGRVIREDSREPVARAYVSLAPAQWGRERTARRSTFSDADGRFRITGVAPGRHTIRAIGDRLATSRETPIVIEAGHTSEEIDLVIEARSTLRGVVVQGGKPIPGVHVSARTIDASGESSDAVSQQDGSFVLEHVPRGHVRFVARPYAVVGPRTFHVERAEHEGVLIEVDQLGSIVGRVLRRDRPVEGAKLELLGPNSHDLGSVRTGADGRFEARGLRPGRWVVYGWSERHGAFGRAPDVQLERGQTAEVTIDLAFSAAISGVVVDQDGAPVPAVPVEFSHTGRDDTGFATTSEDGTFRATTMTGGGQYRVTVRPRARSSVALRPAAGGEFPLVNLADGASEVTGLVLAVRLDRLSIAGRVVDQHGAPVADARVAAEVNASRVEMRHGRLSHPASATTDVEGRFSIGDLSAGLYGVRARSSTGEEAIAEGVAAGRKDVAIVLPSPGIVEGTLTGFREAPRVSATRRDSAAAGAVFQGTVSGTSFRIQPLSPGTYVVSARTGTEAASARVEVTAGATANVALTSTGSGSVTGRVRDFHSGAPVEGMRCVPWPRLGTDKSGGWIGDGARTDREGVFELAAVPAGEIAIACNSQGISYTDGLRLVTVASSQRTEVDVPVVPIRQDVSFILAGIGGELDLQSFVARLNRVAPGGPSATAGLQSGDVVIAVDDVSVTELSPRGVWFQIANRPPGTSVGLKVRRGDRTATGTLVLGPPDLR